MRNGFLVMLAISASWIACGGSDTASGTANVGGDAGVAADAGVTDAGVTGGGNSSIVSISLSQTDVHIPVGVMTAFAVTATDSAGNRRDVTEQAQAASSNPSVATVAHGQGAQIQITGVNPGTATITVTVGSLQQSCAVTVTPR